MFVIQDNNTYLMKDIFIEDNGKMFKCYFIYEDTNFETVDNKTTLDTFKIQRAYRSGKIGKLYTKKGSYFGTLVILSKVETNHQLDLVRFVEIIDFHPEEIQQIISKNCLRLEQYIKEDYPQYPIIEPIQKLTKSEDNFELLPEGFVLDSKFTTLYSILKSYIDSGMTKPSDERISEAVKFWKQYRDNKMNEIMNNIKYYNKDSISSCCFISMDFVKENSTFKFNWEKLTANTCITNRDILANPDFSWDEEELVSRELPYSFYVYKKIKGVEENKKKTNIIESLLSPEESKIPDVREVPEDEIEESYQLLLKENPEYFDNINDSYREIIRNAIKQSIEYNGVFIIDDFEFPKNIEYINIFNKIHPIPEPTEDDPYSLRDINERFNKGKESIEDEKYYEKVTGIDLMGFFNRNDCIIKNRNDALNMVKNNPYREFLYNRCKFIFPEDFLKNISRDEISTTVSILNMGEKSIQFFEKYNYYVNMQYAVKYLPAQYVLRNLLFWPDRIKIKVYKENITHEELIKEDKELLKFFIERNDYDNEFIVQNSDILQFDKIFNEILSKKTSSFKNRFLENIKRQSKAYSEENLNSFKDVMKNRIFNCHHDNFYLGSFKDLTHLFEFTDEEWRNNFIKHISKKETCLSLSQYLGKDDFERVKMTKWDAPTQPNLCEMFSLYDDKISLLIVMFYMIKDYSHFLSQMFDFFIELIDYKMRTCEDKVHVFDYVVYLMNLSNINKLAIETYDTCLVQGGLRDKIDCFFQYIDNEFSLKDINKSKYYSINKQLEIMSGEEKNDELNIVI